ncbi:MAG: M28 family peptidase [Gemmatimonadaceae bacterium]
MIRPAYLARIVTALAVSASVLAVTASVLSAQPRAAARRTVWPDEGPATWAPRPTVSAITASDLRTRLYGIADDSMRGRRIGELGNFKTTDYIAREFKRLGLKPAGDNGTYFQILAFGPLGYDSASSTLSAGGVPLERSKEWVPLAPFAAGANGGKASFAGVPTVFAGRWGDTVALNPAIIRGKVAVFVMPPATPRPAPTLLRCDSVPDRFGAQAAAIVEATTPRTTTRVAPAGLARDSRAQAAGAAAVLLISQDVIPATTVTAAWTKRGAMQPAPAVATALAAGAITRLAAARLFGKGVDQLSVGDVGQPVSAQWSYDWKLSDTPARNVVAIKPGADPALAAEYVLLGAHNDHMGTNPPVDHDSLRAVNMVTRRQGANDPVCRPTADQQRRIDSLIARARSIRPIRRDTIMNGADDDGSGTVALLEIAEQFAAEKPARSIIFVSHQGEEAGMLGSRWFVEHPTVPLKDIVAAHNIDMLGKGRVEEVKYGGPASIQTLGARRLSREFGDVIDSVNAVRKEVMAIDKSWDVTANPMNRFCRSDQVNYVVNNVPVTYFSHGYSLDYHQTTDEPQYVDYEHSARSSRFVHDIMMALATRKTRPVITGNDPAYPRCR